MRLELESMRKQLHVQSLDTSNTSNNADVEETATGHTVKLLMQSHKQLETKSKRHDYSDPRRSMQHLSLKDARAASKSAKRIGPIHSKTVTEVEQFLESYVPSIRPSPAATTSASTKAIRSTTKSNMAKVAQQGKSSQGVFSRMHSVSPRFIGRCTSAQRSRGRVMQQQEKSTFLNATTAPKRRTTKTRTQPAPQNPKFISVQNPKPEVPPKPASTSQKYGLSRKILSAEEAAEIVKRTFRERERRPDLVPSVTISLTK